LESWLRVSRTGNLGKIGKSHCRLTELERELANVKGELALTKMERDIMNYPAASCGVSKNTRNEASFGELTLRD